MSFFQPTHHRKSVVMTICSPFLYRKHSLNTKSQFAVKELVFLTRQFEWEASHQWIMSEALWAKGERMEALVPHLGAWLPGTVHSHLYCFHVRRHLDRYCRDNYCQRKALA